MPTITRDQVKVPADVMPEARETYIDNYMKGNPWYGSPDAFCLRPEG